MAIKDILNQVKKEVKVLQGEEAKDKLFTNEQTFQDVATAERAFERAKQKLFEVNGWSRLPGINSTFELFDASGQPLSSARPTVGNFMKIILPASNIENWVEITDIKEEPTLAEFTVHPSQKPEARAAGDPEVKHFFSKEASSTFRVERKDTTIIGYEIGRNESINNRGEEAGNRAVLNTLVAEGGWAGFQSVQWNKLTAFLVHLEEASENK